MFNIPMFTTRILDKSWVIAYHIHWGENHLKAVADTGVMERKVAANIGIKVANGEFYSIFDEDSTVNKRMVLTTAHNNQRSVQVDLYKSNTSTMADAEYMGSLVIDNIKPRKKGEPSIELTIRSKKYGAITVEAVNPDIPGKNGCQTLNISLAPLDNAEDFDMPNLDLDDSSSINYNPLADNFYEKPGKIKRRNPLDIILILILIIILFGLAGLCFFFIFRRAGTEVTETVSFLTTLLRIPPGN